MEKLKTFRLLIIAFGLMWAVSSCSDDSSIVEPDAIGSAAYIGETCGCPPVASRPTKLIGLLPNGGDFYVDANRTLSCDTTYTLRGRIHVRNGATLTIEPGTIVKGQSPDDVVLQRDRVGFLIVEKTGAINAAGTCDCPIVFTSSQPANFREAGDWGGLVLAGNGLITVSSGSPTANIEGFTATEPPVVYGGDNSIIAPASVLQFVRVEFSGIDISGGAGNETNGIVMGALQNAIWTMDHVQISWGGDDSFEWFGGDISGKYLYSYKTVDDDFDFDQGFAGNLQFGVAWRGNFITDVSGSNAIESDGILNSGTCTLPFGATTTAKLSNMTFIGNTNNQGQNFESGVRIREGSNMQLRNSLIGSFPISVKLTDKPTYDNYVASQKMLNQNLFVSTNRQDIGGCETGVGGFTEPNLEALLQSTKNGHVNVGGRGGAATWLGLSSDALVGSGPELVPIEFKTQVDFTGLPAFFTAVGYRGAFGTDDVTNGWCSDCENDNPKWMEFKPEAAEY